MDISYKIYKECLDFNIDDKGLNKFVKGIIIEFPDRSVLVLNDNFGTKEKHMDFTEGRKKADLHPLQIVFTGKDDAIRSKDKYLGSDDKIHIFGENFL